MREQLYHFLTTESSGNVPVASSILFLLTTPKTNHSVLMSLRRKLREVKLGHSLSSAEYWAAFGDCQTPEILSTLASLSKQNTPFLLQNC